MRMGAMFAALFGGLASFLAEHVSKRVFFATSGIIVFGGLTSGLFLAMNTAFAGISHIAPSGSMLLTGMWVALPDNVPNCIAAVIEFDIMMALYHWNTVNMKIALWGH